MKTIFYLSITMTFVFVSLVSKAQTRTIYAKRHNATNYVDEWSNGYSNLGMAPEYWVKNAKLEKVILINDSTAVMFTENECKEKYSGESLRWQPGSDTVVNHDVFTSGLTIPEMQMKLDNDYYFVNNAETVLFEGYQVQEKNKKNIPTKKDNNIGGENRTHQVPLVNKWLILLVIITSAAGTMRIK
ncbi:MAG: hypothetical protein KJ941_01430 [Bacteroidetes bacterium]|nr:hypothetical protein [Bacteroidota bacterium]